MNNCCSNNKTSGRGTTAHYPASHNCPVNGKIYNRVKRKTLLHHISQPWLNSLPEQAYYFCSDPKCDVVYFAEDDTVITSDRLRTAVWQKTQKKSSTLCYCFGVTKALASSDKNIKSFIIEQTKNALCSCETSNPSGHCCLRDFPDS